MLRQSWFIEMLKSDCKLANLAENVDPQELGACDADPTLITHRYGGQECAQFESKDSKTIRWCRGRR